MSDDELRALERAYRATGSVDDHARWIAARLRAGRLCEPRARLAAELGHAAARQALGAAVRERTVADVVQRGFVEVENELRALALRAAFRLDADPLAASPTFDGLAALRQVVRPLAGLAAEAAAVAPPDFARLGPELSAWRADPRPWTGPLEAALAPHLEEGVALPAYALTRLGPRLARVPARAALPVALHPVLDAALELDRVEDEEERAELLDDHPELTGLDWPQGVDVWRWAFERGEREEVAAALASTRVGAACAALRGAADLVLSSPSDAFRVVVAVRALETLVGEPALRAALCAELGPTILEEA